jgi:adenosylcobinamide-phosphate synthase
MVGHRDLRYRRFGWASARLDDVLGWPAARASALLVAMTTPMRLGAVWRTCRFDAPAHPSPNAGVAEAAFAAALDLRLGGINRYGDRVEERPTLGSGAAPGEADIARAMALVRRCLFTLEMVLVGTGLVFGRMKARYVRRGAR